MRPKTWPGARSLAAAAVIAALAAAMPLPAAFAADAQATPLPAREAMAQRFAHHVDEHLDSLAERLEIKASQQPAWQGFATAFRAVMTPPAPPAAGHDADAAAMAREHAQRATDHAQKLARLADATAALQQTLSADQRAVLNEAARHFAREHFGRGAMMPWHGNMEHEGMEHGGWGHGGPDHCEPGPMGHGPMGYPMHGEGLRMDDPHGAAPPEGK